ncbi:MAG: hypothetical protein JO062_08310 [Bryobacterales bacterium]|nr:hypothetical protein [Bryobacterales bacterium]
MGESCLRLGIAGGSYYDRTGGLATRRRLAACPTILLICTFLCAQLYAQRGGPKGPAPAPKAAAPVDFTGYWVSVVTEDWRWRMVTPIKGDFAGIPLTAEGRKVGEAWDPAKDEAAGNQCRAYGAPAVMRIPGRLHITWQDDNTLRMDTDQGTQTRLFHFGGKPAPNEEASWQGYSSAQWEQPVRGSGSPQAGLGATREGANGRSLEVVTTKLRPGYLRKNGPPYSGDAVLKEFFDLSKERNGETWFVVTTIVEDPRYLSEPFVTSTNFKREPDGGKWAPVACSAR